MSNTFDDVPAVSPRRTSRLIDLLWQPLVWAIPFALFFGTLWNAGWPGYVQAYRISLIFSFTIRVATVLAERVLVPRLRAFVTTPAGRYPWWREGGLFALVSVSASLLAALVVDRWVEPAFLQNGRSWSITALYSMAFTLLVGGLIYARIFYRVSVERARQVERMRAELAAAELRALRAQVHPHFLFNTLNTIAALIGEDPRAAEDIVTRLADVFRHSLAATTGEHARFADELEFLRSYLAIEKARLGPRLRFEETIEPGLESVPVPGLLLQPLVENAVRYAVAERESGGTVRLAAERAGESLRVTIADDGPGFRPGAPPRGHGVGLESVRERLRLAGDGHGLAIDSEPGRGTCVTVTLPLQPPPPEPGTRGSLAPAATCGVVLALALALALPATPAAARDDLAAAARTLDAAVATGDPAKIRSARDAIALLQAGEPGVPELEYALALADWRLVPLLAETQKPAAKQLCKEGIAACERALAARPRMADAMALESSLQGVAFQFLSSQAAISLASEMEERYARAAALEPDNPRVLLLRGLHELHKPRDVGGGPARALPLLDRAVAAFAGAPPAPGGADWGRDDALIWRGIAASRAGDWVRARADFRRALEVRPGHAWVERVLLPEAEKRAAGAKAGR